MFKPFYGKCSNPDCNQDNPLIVVKRGLCQFCNHKEKQEKKKKSGKKTGGYTYVKEATGEGELFEEIMKDFGDDPVKCFVCGRRISLLMPHNFAHVLPKGKYSSFRLYKPNIVILCHLIVADENGNQGCHYSWDFKPRSELKGEGWEKMFELEEELKNKHKEGNY
jgi:hypothetical protein